ncbi:unnamed protein product [Mytilus coruscus]|uniref:PHD-type domain-containing protein n=1 Tax=Mytilus coruscus TaxID=42192 RepID=A0A6J8A023_MYTCO|nr:unnamed protein product [Mytilus coruscus]
MAPKVTKDICNNCSKDVVSNDRALSCSICAKWFHIKCERFQVADYDFLQKSDDSIQWSLKHYNKGINSVDKNISELNENLPITIVSQRISQIIDDKSEEEKREANIIIFGIPESEEGNSRIKDTEFIQGLCRDSLEIDNIAIDEITRLGAKPK